ncbi:hypothetical protein ACQRIU_004483 [Beauveria bassiana]
MDPSDLDRFFVDRWNRTLLQCEKQLESDDLERVRQIKSWDALQCDALSNTPPYEISIIEPSLGHLRRFATLFGTELAVDLNPEFFWGILNLLLKITAQDSVALGKIPRMIKSLGYKAEAFSVHYKGSSDNRDQLKEACFDIQVQMVRFLAACIQSMRGEEATPAAHLVEGESSPWNLLQRDFTRTNQELAETLAQVESLAAVHLKTDHAASSDMAACRPRFRCLMAPTKNVSSFFDRADTFDKIDQAIGGPGSSPSFRSVALHGLGGIGKSTIAARYIERKFEENEYDAIFWVNAERTASLRQSFTDIALRLELDGAKPNLHDDNLIIVQNWLQLTEHVLSLKDHLKGNSELCDASSVSTFCELLRDCQRYLYEANALDDLEDVCKVNLWAAEKITNEEQAADLIAWTLSLQASMYESIGKVETAIDLNLRGYEMRLAEKPLKHSLLGGFEQNLAYNYNTANQHEKALEWFIKSKDRIVAWNLEEGREADWPTVTKKNMARCLVYLGQHAEAEKLLNDSITEFKQEKVLNWAMLAYAYYVKGTLERKTDRLEAAEASFIEAQNLWTRGDQTRLHPFHAGCIYKTGVTCLDQGKVEAAVKHLGEALTMTKFHANIMPAEHARCLFKLSEALLQDSYNDGEKAKDLRDDAEMYLLRRDAQATEFGREDSYDLLVPIFWR